MSATFSLYHYALDVTFIDVFVTYSYTFVTSMVICAPCTDCLSLLCLSYTLSTVIFFSSLLINILCARADLSFLPAFFFYGDIELNPGPTNVTVYPFHSWLTPFCCRVYSRWW